MLVNSQSIVRKLMDLQIKTRVSQEIAANQAMLQQLVGLQIQTFHSQMEDGSVHNAKTIILVEELSVIDVIKLRQNKITMVNQSIS